MSGLGQLDDGINMESEGQDIISENDELLTNLFAQRKGEFEVCLIRAVQRVIGPVMEHLVRKVVKEQLEVVQENLMTSIKRNLQSQASTSEPRDLQLKFLGRLSLPIYTGKKIKGEGSTPIQVALVDSITGQLVSSGPEASARFEMVVLEGYSAGNGGDNYNFQDFNSKIVREWKGKKTILKGSTCFNLKEGISNIDELSFIHNSGWMKSCELFLGAKPVDFFPGTTIKAGKTESFILKDNRTTFYGKRYPPCLSDKVWTLKKINKKGCFLKRLTAENISTVKDFLKLLVTDPQKLQKILRAGAKTWEVITEHAKTCVIGEELYLYYYTGSQQHSGVVFNEVGQVKGLLRESEYIVTDSLSEKEKKDAQKSVIPAFENWEEVIPFDNETLLNQHSSHSLESPMPNSPNGGNQGEDPPLINTHEHQKIVTRSNDDILPVLIGEPGWLDAIPSLSERSDQPIYSPDPILNVFVEHEHLPHSILDDFVVQPKKSKKTLAMVFFVLKWFWTSRRRIGALEEGHVKKKQRIC